MIIRVSQGIVRQPYGPLNFVAHAHCASMQQYQLTYKGKTVEPLEYYRRFLKEACRPDGRELTEFRTTTINVGSITTADGSALVKLGNCTVLCGVKAELAAPPADSPDKGYVGK
ncbi:hypothetical protein XELAEV_18016151mg [Xenopus laevis]|uniref:Ribosomal RNA-processing protein 43 n=1 Tax=Xenopus laevis TaxID=8355 RepID=A0A974DJJ0_XENLA|nr:hypothetical protein XELAEV_18016151mg [Xenopus laevis]